MLRDRFDPRYYEPDVLFRYHAGWAHGGQFTRSSPATYFDRTGVLREAGPDVPRIDWSHGRPALRLEPQRTNLVPSPRLDTDSNGDGIPDGVLVSAHADYTVTPLSMSDGTFTFRVERIADTGGWGGGIRIDIPGIVQGDVLSSGIDVLVTPGSTPLVGATLCFWEYEDDATGQLVTIPAVQYPADGQWHRLLIENTTIEQAARANTFRLIVRLRRGASDPIGGAVTVSVRRPQIERSPIASSFVVGTRATETVTGPWPHAPQPMTLYVRMVEVGGVLRESDSTIVRIGSSPDNRVVLFNNTATHTYALRYASNGSVVTRSLSVAPVREDIVECLIPIDEAGAYLAQAINGSDPTQTTLAGLPIPTAWEPPTLAIGGGGQFDLLDLLVLDGASWTMDAVRRYLPW